MKKLFLLSMLLLFLPILISGQNVLLNPGFEEGDLDANGIPDGWIGYAQTGASIQFISDSSTAYNGDYWSKCTSTNGGYYLLYQATYPAKEGDVWEFSSFIKDVSPTYPGACYAALKISAKNSAGGTFKYWEEFQDSVTTDWQLYSNTQTMPEGTAYIQAVIVVHGADGAPEASYGFDDVKLELIGEHPVDTTGTNILANPGFEDGDQDGDGIPDGWIGYAQSGASLELVKSATTAYNGSNWSKCTSTNGGYYLLYQATYPAKEGEVWDFSSFIKDVSPAYPGACYAALKISAKNSAGGTFKAWEEFQDSVPSYWKRYSNTQTMPEGTAFIQAVIVVHGADGAPEASYGFDDVKLKLIYENPQVDTTMTNILANPGFEDGDQDGDGIPDGWIGYAQTGASMEFIKSATTAYNGSYWSKCTSTNGGYYLLYQVTYPAKEGDIWKFSSFIKDVSPAYPGACYAALKISAKNSAGGTFKYWEEFQDTVTSYWKLYSNTQTMPEGTAYIQAVIVVHGADGAPEASYGFDDVSLELIYENPPADTVNTNILANPGFEDGDQDGDGIPDGWIGYAQTGASIELVKSGTSAYNGSYWSKCTSTNGGYYLLYQVTYPSKEGDVWKFSSFIKDVSPAYPGACYAALKISAKNSAGGTFKFWEEFQDTVTSYWKEYSNTQTMPEGTAYIQAVIVVHGADGAPEASYGFDDVKLELIGEHPVDTTGTNILANPGFEDGDQDGDGIPDGWIGYAQTGASMELVKSGTSAYNGSYWSKCTSTNGGYYLLYQVTYPSKEGDVWEFSSFIKDVSPAYPGACYAALKISAKNSAGGTFKAWEEFQDSVPSYWKRFSNTQTMPEGTAYIQAVIVVHGADGASEASYGFDDVKLKLIEEYDITKGDLNMISNPGFEDGDQDGDLIPDGWIGYAQTGASLELVKSATSAYNGSYWAKCTSTMGGYYLLYQNTIPANPSEVWKLSSFIKDVSPKYPGACFAALKISAKDKSSATIKAWEVFQDSVPSYWKRFSNTQTMPEGTSYLQAVIVVNGADGSPESSYGFDDVKLELIHELTNNPGFESGDSTGSGIPNDWLGGGTTNTHVETINDANAHSGNYWAKVSVDDGNGWYVLYKEGFAAKKGEIWSLRSFIKDVSPDSLGDFAYLKISAKDSNGTNVKVWEILQEGVTKEWKDYSITETMPEGTSLIQPVLVVKKSLNDGKEASYGFDDIRVVKLGIDTTSSAMDDKNNIIYTYELKQNYPNPFNPATVIKYSIKNAGHVTVKVYDVIGQEVLSLVNEEKNVGSYEVIFNAGHLSSGMYIYQIKSGTFVDSKKMLLLK